MAALILLGLAVWVGFRWGRSVSKQTHPQPELEPKRRPSGLQLQRRRKPFRLTGQRRPAAPKLEKELAPPTPRANIDGEARASLEGALRGLGFRPAHVSAVLDRLADRVGRESRSETLKAALADLVK